MRRCSDVHLPLAYCLVDHSPKTRTSRSIWQKQTGKEAEVAEVEGALGLGFEWREGAEPRVSLGDDLFAQRVEPPFPPPVCEEVGHAKVGWDSHRGDGLTATIGMWKVGRGWEGECR